MAETSLFINPQPLIIYSPTSRQRQQRDAGRVGSQSARAHSDGSETMTAQEFQFIRCPASLGTDGEKKALSRLGLKLL